MSIARFYSLLAVVTAGTFATGPAGADETADQLLSQAKSLYQGAQTSQSEYNCVAATLGSLLRNHGTSDAAVDVVLGNTIDGLDLGDIQQRTGLLGAQGSTAEQSGDEGTFRFMQDYPDAFTHLCKELGADLAWEVGERLTAVFLEFGLTETVKTILTEDPQDVLRGLARTTDLADVGPKVVVDRISQKLAVLLLDGYAHLSGADVNSEAIVSVASPTAQLIVAASMGSGPAAPALTAGVAAYKGARGAALASYAEDERFAEVSQGLVSADFFRRAAGELRSSGQVNRAQVLEDLAESIVEHAANSAIEAFKGSDGPVVAKMLRDMDQVIQMLRAGKDAEAQALLEQIHAEAEGNAPGFFSLSLNNAYERYFMIGWQNTADSIRAYVQLEHVLYQVFADTAAAPETGDSQTDQPEGKERRNEWGPDILLPASVNPSFAPCAEETDKRACLSNIGVPPEAIDFALAIDPSGQSFATQFQELGRVDLAVTEYTGASPILEPVFLNGQSGLHRVEGISRQPASKFSDDTSQRFLRANPTVFSTRPSVSGHRLLPNGAQRFSVTYPLSTCRACQNNGVAVTAVDFDAQGRFIAETPIGIVGLSLAHHAGYALQKPTAETILSAPAVLQYALNIRGYDAGQMDGYPGPQTRTALMAFQVEHCLPPTGQPDPATVGQLARADAFSAPCAQQALPQNVVANSPLRPGIYVDNSSYCAQESVPWDVAHQSQRIIKPGTIHFGVESMCETRRTDIRDGVTLFRGTCFEGNQSIDGRWRFDVTSPTSFVDLGFETQRSVPRAFAKCDDGSVLHNVFQSWFPAPDAQAGVPANASSNQPVSQAVTVPEPTDTYFEPQRGSELRSLLMDIIRPEAEQIYGPPVEFMVNGLRVNGPLAYASLIAQRPGGGAIAIEDTPGYRAGDLYLEPGDPEAFDTFLVFEGNGWRVEHLVPGATEAWWLNECNKWRPLFPRLCKTEPNQATQAQSAVQKQPEPPNPTADTSQAFAFPPEGTMMRVDVSLSPLSPYSVLTENGFVQGVPTFRYPSFVTFGPKNPRMTGVVELDRTTAHDILHDAIVGGLFVYAGGGVVSNLRVPEPLVPLFKDGLARALLAPTSAETDRALQEVNALLIRGSNSIDMRQMNFGKFLIDIGYYGIGLWQYSTVHWSGGSAPIFNLGNPNHNGKMPDWPQMEGFGFLVGLFEVDEVLGIFKSDTTAEVEFTFKRRQLPSEAFEGSGTTPRTGLTLEEILTRADATGQTPNAALAFPEQGQVSRVRTKPEEFERVWTAQFRKYDDGWRFYSLR